MSEKLNPEEKVLLSKDVGVKPKVVKGLGKKGNIDSVDIEKAKSSDFLVIDRHTNMLENFFKNFIKQSRNPSHTGFYVIATKMLDKAVKMSDQELEQYRVSPKEYIERQQNKKEDNNKQQVQNKPDKSKSKMKQDQENKVSKQEFTKMDTSKISDSEYKKFGISAQDVESELKAMSYGFKSPHLVELKPKIEGVEYPVKARLSLEEQADGSLKLIPYPYQEKVDLDKPFQGVVLPDDVKENLLSTGNAGRVVELEPNTPGKKVPSLVSVDKLTNRLEAIPLNKIKLTQNLKGTELSGEQIKDLKEGKNVLVEQMTSKKTMGTDSPKKFDAYVQFNAAKGSFDFSYDGLNRDREQSQDTEQRVRIPKKLLGVELDEKQQKGLREGKSVYVQGMMKDAQQQPFNAYIKVNNEKGKLDFFKWDPDKAKKQDKQVKPAQESKTQTAVNNEGKTNEATKDLKEPLKQAQQKPTENQKQSNSKKEAAIKKPRSKGVKM